MNNYVGNSCPVCKKKFTLDDDIVVCPDCGAPHHRKCYMEKNQCAFKDEHISGKVWQPTVVTSTKAVKTTTTEAEGDFCINPRDGQRWQSTGEDATQCSFCGFYNPKDNIFCCSCGRRLNASDLKSSTGYYHNDAESPQPYSNKMDINTAIYGTVSPQYELDGITAREYAVFVGKGSNSYLTRFKNLAEDSKSVNFNIFAFFFSGAYFIYRKMYKLGILIIVLNLILTIPSGIYMANVTLPVVAQAVEEVMQDNAVYPDQKVIYERLETQMKVVGEAKIARYALLNNIASILRFAMNMALGFFSYNLYFMHAKKKITNVKNGFSEGLPGVEQDKLLSDAGGIDIKTLLIAAGIAFVIYYALVLYYIQIL